MFSFILFSKETLVMAGAEYNQVRGENEKLKKAHISEFCQKEPSNVKNFNAHKRIHLGDKNFKCSFCDYSTTYKSSLTSHVRTHTAESVHNQIVIIRQLRLQT